MTTDKQSKKSELWNKLRQGIEKLKPAPEEEIPGVEAAFPEEEAQAPEAAAEAEETAASRASEDEIVSALRRFAWVAETPEPPRPEEAGEPEDVEPREDAEALPETVLSAQNLLEEPLPEPEAAQEEPEEPLDLDRFLAEVKAEVADAEPAELPEEEPVFPIEPPLPELEADIPADAPESAPDGNEAESGQEERKIGFDLEALLRAVELLAQDPGKEEAQEGSAEEGEEARVWKPGDENHPAVDSADAEALVREETHVFSKDDMESLHQEQEGGEDLPAEEPEEEAEDLEPMYTARDFHPVRRRRNYRTGLMGGIRYFLFVICVSVALACFAWLAADDVLSLNKEYLEAEVYIGEDMRLSQVATELHSKGLIRYRRLFTVFAKLFHAEEKIQPGTYKLSTKLDYRALIQNMHSYTGWTGEAAETVKVTIPEGKTVMETFQILAEHGVCPYETLMECAATETFDYPFLADIPDGEASRLEGYLFPDTYEFYADSSPKAAINRFLDNFTVRFSETMMEQVESSGYTLREILTVASLIEMEAGNDEERGKIASVIYNRLQSTAYPYLQIDATIQYAMGERKESLTYEDLEVDSPYNTYKYPGLPPGPIANCGLASIRAALNPENTGYYFYALNKSGGHEFFSSYNDFNRFVNSSSFGG